MKKLIFSVLILSLCSNNSFAQNAINDATKLKTKGVRSLNTKPIASTNPANLDVVAGIYEIHPLNTNNCAGSIDKGMVDAIAGHLWHGMGLVKCGDYINSKVALIPRPGKKYTIRSLKAPGLGYFNLDYAYCANVARNVIIGPKAIDFTICDSPPNAKSKSDVGLEDQQFSITKIGDGIFQINTFDNECLDVRNQGTSLGTEIVKWACNGQNNQKFRLTYIEPFTISAILDGLREDGLY